MKLLLFSSLFIIFSLAELSAQWDNNIVCPGDSSHCQWLDTVSERRVQLSARHDQYAFVTYRYRYCNGVLEIDVLSITTVDNAGKYRTFELEHFEFKTLRSAIELGLMTDHEREIGIDSLPTINPDPGTIYTCADTVSYVSFFSASCGIFVNCTYSRSDSTRFCQDGYVPPYPEIMDTVPKVVYRKWQSCGYNCCKKTYRICRDMSSTTGVSSGNSEAKNAILRILEVSITSVSDCSLQGNYGSKPCYTNCWNNP